MATTTKSGLRARLKAYFMRGLLVMTPIAVICILFRFVYDLLDSWIGPLAALLVRSTVPAAWLGPFKDGNIPGLSLVVFTALLVALGLVGSARVGRRGLRLIDALFESIPGVRVIYTTVHKLVLSIGDADQRKFKRAVFIKHGGTDILTLQTSEFVDQVTGVKHLVVWWPHTPNMSSGFLLTPREDEAVDAGLTPDQLMAIELSLGALMPPALTVTAPRTGDGGR